jgi:predicted RNA-binding protein with PUA-like domain
LSVFDGTFDLLLRPLFYHTAEEKAVIGIARVKRTVYADKTASEGDWGTVDLVPIKSLCKPLTLREIKANPRPKKMQLVRQSRLPLMPLMAQAFREIVRMAD